MSSTTVFGQGTGDNAFDPVESLNYEQARDELIEVVRILELGQMGLDESLKYWERGEALAKRCEEHLAGAARRVEAALQGTTKTTTATAMPAMLATHMRKPPRPPRTPASPVTTVPLAQKAPITHPKPPQGPSMVVPMAAVTAEPHATTRCSPEDRQD